MWWVRGQLFKVVFFLSQKSDVLKIVFRGRWY